MTITQNLTTVGTAFPVVAIPGNANDPMNISVLNVTSIEAPGDYLQIVVDGVVKATVRIGK